MTRIVIHILIPLNLVISLCLVGGGIIQNLNGAEIVSLVEPIMVRPDGKILENAEIDLDAGTVTVDGKVVEDAEIVTEQFVPMRPAALWFTFDKAVKNKKQGTAIFMAMFLYLVLVLGSMAVSE